MQTRSVIEIVESGGRLPTELIVAGYWASQAGLVAFVLNGVTPQAINLVLDPIVTTLPLSIPGVLYIDISDRTRVREAVMCAEEIYGASKIFRHLTDCYGIAPSLVLSVAVAIPKLESRTLLSERDSRAPKIAEPEIAAAIHAPNRLGWRATDSIRRSCELLQTSGSTL
ncbi:hypothetical protein ILFOPFJJ_03985 [Ensifer psoraleae]|uniref:hypothetical protein n=1 Tax=Sinorhizobium psoraleae TaxID=520838 RepID=UPI001567EF04|nr:hypothetical protein [Sinorhizobium psoraleae]NRP73086.1 hypothetical protein [Sinorhizobium psoraleae]